MCKRRLNPGGVVAQWVPLYESNLAAVKSEITTFLEVFPDGTVWSNESDGKGYDLVLLGQVGPTTVRAEQLEKRLARDDHLLVALSPDEVDLGTVPKLLAMYAGRGWNVRPWLKGAQINRDRDLRLQYLAGMGLNSYEADRIYRSLRLDRRYPEDLLGPPRPGEPSLAIESDGRPSSQ
jgi:spermidine synthase